MEQNLNFKATIFLIGSYARGDFNFWSDIDILLVAETNKPPHRRLENTKYDLGFQIIFLTPEEFRHLLQKREPVIIEALTKGIIIRDDYNLNKQINHS
ncbi:MAG: nucleotidyltransferase domain-containing protein [Candidatus Njordarchaeota archaeon]